MAGPAARHPAVTVGCDASRRPADDMLCFLFLLRADGQTRVADDPHRRWCLRRQEWTHLRAGIEGNIVEGIVFALEARFSLGPELAQNSQAFFKDPGAPLEVQSDGRVLAPH